MKQKALLTVVGILALAGVAWAEDYVCEDTVLTGKFRRYIASVSATQVALGTNEACTVVSKENTPAQRAINLGSPNAQPPVPPTVPVKYRKVLSGLVVEMTQGEKDAVDDAEEAVSTIRNDWRAEITTPEACPFTTIAALNAYFNDQVTELTTLIQATPTGAVRQALTGIATTSLTNERRLAKLLCARAKAGQ